MLEGITLLVVVPAASTRRSLSSGGYVHQPSFLVRRTLLARQATHIRADIEIVDDLLAEVAAHGTTDSGSKASSSPPRRAGVRVGAQAVKEVREDA